MPTKKDEKKEKSIIVRKLELRTQVVTVGSMGDSTYVPHRLPVEVVKKFRKKQFGVDDDLIVEEVIRDPDAEFQSCFYTTHDGEYGIPAAAFVKAMLYTITDLNIAKTEFKRSTRILGDILPMRYEKILPREDVVGGGGRNKTPDVRFRPEFVNWECDLTILYDKDLISLEAIINLVNRAGHSAGVGDWRPSAPHTPGSHGLFTVLNPE